MVVLGAGASGLDISMELATAGAQVPTCSRRRTPRDVTGVTLRSHGTRETADVMSVVERGMWNTDEVTGGNGDGDGSRFTIFSIYGHGRDVVSPRDDDVSM